MAGYGMRISVILAQAFCIAVTLGSARVHAEIRVVDDKGRSVVLERPAQRIVSLAPHLTELLFAAGAGVHIVGTVKYSDYPEAAKHIPRVGDNLQLDLERIVALKPNLIVVWLHGNAQRQLDKLLRLGIPVFYNEPHRLEDIGRSIEQLGQLAGTESIAHDAARAFAASEAVLRNRYANRQPVKVFYQIWKRPLMTINDHHFISAVIRLCGGRNIFGKLASLVPVVSTEAVLAANPEAIVTAVFDDKAQDDLDDWRKWPQLRATAHNNFFYIPTDFISRPTPRILEGAQRMCADLDRVRARQPH